MKPKPTPLFPPPSPRPARRLPLVTLGIMMGVVLTACTPPSVQEKLPAAMGNATPVSSPAVVDEPTGEVISLPEQLAKVTELDHIGEVIAVRAGAVVGVGTVDQLRAGRLVTVPVDAACGDISATPASNEFVLGCPDGVYGIPTSVANTADDAGGAGEPAAPRFRPAPAPL